MICGSSQCRRCRLGRIKKVARLRAAAAAVDVEAETPALRRCQLISVT